MKTRIFSTLFALGLAIMAAAQGPLTIKGKIFAASQEGNASLEVLVNGTDVHQIPLSRTGKFEVAIYENEHYVFSFSQDGCIEKSIVIDTSMPQGEVPVGKLVFDVAMEPVSTKMPNAIICAMYTYSSDDSIFVYNEPPSSIEGIAEIEK